MTNSASPPPSLNGTLETIEHIYNPAYNTLDINSPMWNQWDESSVQSVNQLDEAALEVWADFINGDTIIPGANEDDVTPTITEKAIFNEGQDEIEVFGVRNDWFLQMQILLNDYFVNDSIFDDIDFSNLNLDGLVPNTINIQCPSIDTGGIAITVVTESGGNSNARSNIQLSAALQALSSAFSQSANNSITLPGIGTVGYANIFDGVSGQSLDFVVDNQLSDNSRNETDSPITITTAAGHEIVIQPGGFLNGYIGQGPNGGTMYIDVDSNVGGGLENLMETILHEVMHGANPQVSETNIRQAAKDIIADLQARGVLPDASMQVTTCPSSGL